MENYCKEIPEPNEISDIERSHIERSHIKQLTGNDPIYVRDFIGEDGKLDVEAMRKFIEEQKEK